MSLIEDIRVLAADVRVRSVNPRDPVHVRTHPDSWRCVGVGNSAAVFQPKDHPELAIKIYAPEFEDVCATEAGIYEQLGDNEFFPRYYGRGEGFLVIEYRPGKNLYDCLVQGVEIPEQAIHDVDTAIAYAQSRGLNPSDIHVKNVLVHNGRGHLVDVSDYRELGDCKRWPDLKSAYYDYYRNLYRPGLTVPSWVLETIRKWYKSPEGGSSNIGTFAERIIRMFF
ncbi:serine/threonine protein kinase [Tumebacillus sp. ITR2]|uniref:Serine/threonine protein kinase n=1 Tax=Tumebacillus amylolyticus TaxID=2801339 RepID=A0ABS1JDZ6_9BACL|nr:serine/threonine protein kinase [Tumebacillus amylolyticus]MBL0388509.1 serine/threonine protein kinase [Tumebacillus amylolyticus]